MIRIFVADDHPVVRAGIRMMVDGAPELVLIGESSNGRETIEAIGRDAPEVIVLDLWMEGNDGVEIVRSVRAIAPATRILVFSMSNESVLGPRVLRAGGAGYLMKDRGLDELKIAIETVAGGSRYLSPALATELTNLALRTGRAPGAKREVELALLTDRELQVFRLVGQGRSSAVIAKSLNVSTKTVGRHRENLKNKLNLANSAELVQRAMEMLRARLV